MHISLQSSASPGSISTKSGTNRPKSLRTSASVCGSVALMICGFCRNSAGCSPARRASAIGNADFLTEFFNQKILDMPTDAGKDGAAQDQDLSVAELIAAQFQRLVHRGETGVEMFVDRRADNQHEKLALSQQLWRNFDFEKVCLSTLVSISCPPSSMNGICPLRIDSATFVLMS